MPVSIENPQTKRKEKKIEANTSDHFYRDVFAMSQSDVCDMIDTIRRAKKPDKYLPPEILSLLDEDMPINPRTGGESDENVLSHELSAVRGLDFSYDKFSQKDQALIRLAILLRNIRDEEKQAEILQKLRETSASGKEFGEDDVALVQKLIANRGFYSALFVDFQC